MVILFIRHLLLSIVLIFSFTACGMRMLTTTSISPEESYARGSNATAAQLLLINRRGASLFLTVRARP